MPEPSATRVARKFVASLIFRLANCVILLLQLRRVTGGGPLNGHTCNKPDLDAMAVQAMIALSTLDADGLVTQRCKRVVTRRLHQLV
jgi:hypothetical protein